MATGLAPSNAAELRRLVGIYCRQVVSLANTASSFSSFSAATDFKAAPYGVDADEEALLKSAIGAAGAVWAGVDFTFITRVAGPF